jgi:glucokinase
MSGPETIGVDLGGTKMLVGVVDSERKVLHESRETSAHLSQDELIAGLERELREAIDACPDAAAIGLGLPCTIDQRTGVAIQAVNLPIKDLPIRDLIGERFDIPVFIDNDANVAALAEHRFGAARGTRNVVMLTIGTGIGGGLILNGLPYRGSTGGAAELGHIVIQLDGPRCQGSCPGFGHAETLASGTALGRDGEAAARRNPHSALGRALLNDGVVTGTVVTEAARAGDETAVEVVALVGRRLGAALSGYANVFEPDLIVIGGGVAAGAGELLVGPAREEVRARALAPMNETRVSLAELGPESGMLGAAELARLGLEGGAGF